MNSRVSLTEAARLVGGVGVSAEDTYTWESGELSLHASLDFSWTFRGAETIANVSGEKLESESAKSRVLLGLGGYYRWEHFSLGGEALAIGLGTKDTEYSSLFKLGVSF